MPRILVADDNSNIQKMVALAFKDDGIEVVAVGNGDAAIRKIPAISPDLILADVFMPVRNGYEVCEFVKLDPRYMHMPVVLLVGAFDPLDEREVQRVHADGVLKKPFVPPDPLINVVKGLLAKAAGERLVAATVPVAAGAAPAEAMHSPAPAPPPLPAHAKPSVIEEVNEWGADPAPVTTAVAPPPEERAEFPEMTPAPSAATAEPQVMDEPELTVTASRDPSLGEPAFWKRPAPAPSPDVVIEEVTEDHRWGRGSDADEEREGFAAPELPAIEPIVDPTERVAPPSAQASATIEEIEPLLAEALVSHAERTQHLESAAKTAESSAEQLPALQQEAAAEPARKTQAGEPVAQEEEPAGPEPIAFPASLMMPEFPKPEIAAEESPLWPAEPLPEVIEFSPASRTATQESAQAPQPAAGETSASEPQRAEPRPDQPAPSWPPFQPPSAHTGDLDGGSAGHTNQLVVDSGVQPASSSEGDFAAVPDADFDEDIASAPHVGSGPAAQDSTWPPKFQPVLSGPEQESADIAQTEAGSSGAEQPQAAESQAEEAAADTPASAPPAQKNSDVVDALVARIIERMQPKIMDVLNREVLRPVVEDLVRREIDKS